MVQKYFPGMFSKGVEFYNISYRFQKFLQFAKPGKVLEVGIGDAIFTELLSDHFEKIVAIDVSKEVCEKARAELLGKSNVEILVADAEEFYSGEKYENIVLAHVLEHVNDPMKVLKNLKNSLEEKGSMFVSVPNSHSIHRQVAVVMGLIKNEKDFSEKDLEIGHKRIFNMPDLISLVQEAGYKILHSGGYYLKPLSNSQIDKWFTKEMIEAFMKLGELYPDIAAEIYVVLII